MESWPKEGLTCPWETGHNFIQWLFPLPEPGVNPKAPQPTVADMVDLGQDPKVKEAMIKHHKLYMTYLGINMDNARVTYRPNKLNLLDPSNHNTRRISRMLQSLVYLGLDDLAVKTYWVLVSVIQTGTTKFQTSHYWPTVLQDAKAKVAHVNHVNHVNYVRADTTLTTPQQRKAERFMTYYSVEGVRKISGIEVCL